MLLLPLSNKYDLPYMYRLNPFYFYLQMYYMNKMQFITLYIQQHFTSYSCIKLFVRLHACITLFCTCMHRSRIFFEGGGLWVQTPPYPPPPPRSAHDMDNNYLHLFHNWEVWLVYLNKGNYFFCLFQTLHTYDHLKIRRKKPRFCLNFIK